MKPLGSLLCVLFAIFLKTSCGSSYNELDQKDLEALRDIWFNAISKRSNESLSKQSDEFKQLIDVLSKLNPSGNKQNIFRDMKNVMLKNAREKTFGIFTNFCGPGNLSGQSTVCGVFNGVDECCKAHDSCEHYIGLSSSCRSFNQFITISTCSVFHELHRIPKVLPKAGQEATLLFFADLRLWRRVLQLHKADELNLWRTDSEYLQHSAIKLLQIWIRFKVFKIRRVSGMSFGCHLDSNDFKLCSTESTKASQ